MTNKWILAQGRLRHRFHGQYSALIGLQFQDKQSALTSLPLLGGGWKATDKAETVLLWEGNSKELEACKDILEYFHADRSAIDSVRHSIDYGEPFEIKVPIK